MLVDGANIPEQCKDRGVLIIEKIKRVGGLSILATVKSGTDNPET